METGEGDGAMEAQLIDSLFYRCDTLEVGRVNVDTVIDYLQNCLASENNEPDLESLGAILEADSEAGDINLHSYRKGVKLWIAGIRHRRESTRFLESDGLIAQHMEICGQKAIYDTNNSSADCLESSGIADDSLNRSEHDVGELLSQLEDVKFQSRRLAEENATLHGQLDAQEEVVTSLTAQLHARARDEELLRRKTKSLQELVNLRQLVIDENEDLKVRMNRMRERRKELENRVSSLDRDNLNLEHQNRDLEIKWQTASQQLEAAQTELQELHSSYVEHKHNFYEAQDARECKELLLAEKVLEMDDLKRKVKDLEQLNEKLREGKDGIHAMFTQAQARLQRYETKLQSEKSPLTPSVEKVASKVLSAVPSRLAFSTPLTRHSICMELRDKLDEDRHLPSPLCEKLEMSNDMSLFMRSAVLPAYMSAWELDGTNNSDYSVDLIKSRRSLLTLELCEADFEKKAEGLKNLEKDAMYGEIIKLYRVNIDLAEKWHKAELREGKLQEVVDQLSNRSVLACQQLEESLESVRAARDVDLRDLWRIVQKDIEKECSDDQSDTSSTSTEFLKHQITFEIEALKNRLQKREAALGALNCTTREGREYCHKKSSNSPLVDALDISVRLPDYSNHARSVSRHRSPCRVCYQTERTSQHRSNRSVPLVRRHTCDMALHTDLSTGSSTSGVSSTGDDCCPLHPTCGTGEHGQPGSGSRNTSDTASAGSGNMDSSTSSQVVNLISNCDTNKDRVNGDVHADKGQVIRRPSYKTAIENAAGSVEDVTESSGYSFQSSTGQEETSPMGPPQIASASTSGSTTPEDGSLGSWKVTAPRYSSTPLPQLKLNVIETHFHTKTSDKCITAKGAPRIHSTKQLENSDFTKDSSGVHQHAPASDEVLATKISRPALDKCDIARLSDISEVSNSSNTDKSVPRPAPAQSSLSASIQAAIQADVLKSGGLPSNRSPPCSNHRLSVLLEEDAHGETGDTSLLQSPRGPMSCSSRGHMSYYLGSSSNILSTPQLEYSAEIWTLSGSSDNSPDLHHSRPASCQTSESNGSLSSSCQEPESNGLNTNSSHTSESTRSNSNSGQTSECNGSTSSHITESNRSHSNSGQTSEINKSHISSCVNSELNQGTSSGNILDIPHSTSTDANSSCNQGDEDKYVSMATDKSSSPTRLASNGPSTIARSAPLPSTGRELRTSTPISSSQQHKVGTMPTNNRSMSPTLSMKYECSSKSAYQTLEGTREKLTQLTKASSRPEMSLVSLAMMKLAPKHSQDVANEASSVVEMVKDMGTLPNHVSTDIVSPKSSDLEHNNNMNKKMGQPVADDDGHVTVGVISPDGIQDLQNTGPGLSKIRESHLARRRDHKRQLTMPQLSELTEKDNAAAMENGPSNCVPVIQVKDDVDTPPVPNGDVIMPSIPNEFLQKLGLTAQGGVSSDDLTDQEIESKFASLSLAFKTDSQTLAKRLEIQERSRDIAEQNVDKELKGLRTCLATLNQICTDPQVREVLMKIQAHIDILENSTARVSSRAEVYGAIQQEERMSKAVEIMIHHVENLRRVHEKEHAELEEARKLLQDSRSLGPSPLDLGGGAGDGVLSRRSASVCQNNFLGKSTRRRVSEIALPRVLGGAGATLHPSSSMDSVPNLEARYITHPPSLRADNSVEVKEDARSKFQAVVASATVKTAVANTLRRASLDRQSAVQMNTPSSSPIVSRDNSQESKATDSVDKDKQKSQEEDAFKKGYEQGMRVSLGKDLSGLREEQNHINESLAEMMDSIENHTEEPKSLKEMLVARITNNVPSVKISGWRIRMTMGCLFIVMAIISIIISLFPVGSASLIGYQHYGRPPL